MPAGVEESAGRGYTIRHSVRERNLPVERRRKVAAEDYVSLVDGGQNRPHDKRDDSRTPNERSERERAPQAAKATGIGRAHLEGGTLQARSAALTLRPRSHSRVRFVLKHLWQHS